MAKSLLILSAAMMLLTSSLGKPAEAMETFTSGNFSFTYTKNGVNLKYKGVNVIRRSSLYIVAPGWTKLLFGHHLEEHEITEEDIPGGKLVKVSMGNENFSAVYSVTMLESDSVTIDLAYRLVEDIPAEMEYCLGFISAPLIADRPFQAETKDGPVSGIVPYAAESADQRESMLVPSFRRLKFDSRLAHIDLQISGDEPDLVIFDARKDPQAWAQESPVFWCGLGVPQRPVPYGRERHITARMDFIPREDVKVLPVRESEAELIPLENAKLPTEELVRIIPEPKFADMTGREFPIRPETLIVLPDDPSEEDYFAAESLNEELRDIYGMELQVIRAGEAKSGSGIIAIGEKGKNSVAGRLLPDAEVPDHAEGYVLKACPQFVVVTGSDVRGTYYGVQTLLQLLKPAVDGAAAHGALIRDWPTLEFRGAHVFIGNEAKPFLQKMIRRIFTRHKLNHLVIQADYTKWESHPEIHLPWSTSKSDLKEIIDYARLHHMEVTPLVQSLGHSQWMFKNDSNLHLVEDPSHPYAYCPLNPGSYEFIFQIYDEAVELFQPRYFHIGHDEVTMFGKFPNHEACKEQGVSRLFLDDVDKLHKYFSEKGIKVMMWGDMMLYRTETPDAGWAESLEAAKERREALPKDIIMADWHYCAADDFPSVRMFRDLGFEVIGCTWYTQKNIEDFSRIIKRDGGIGLMQTLWSGYNISEKLLGPEFRQYHAYILAGEYAWNEGGTSLEELGYDPAEEFTRLWQREKADFSVRDGFAVDLSPFANLRLSGENGWLGRGPEDDLRSFRGGRLRGVDFRLSEEGAVLLSGAVNPPGEWPSGVRIPLGRKAENLVFLLCSAWPAEKGTRVGRILVRYSSTEAMVVDLVYGENITAWTDTSSASLAPAAWVGRNLSGDRITLRVIGWRNPYPERAIESIEILSTGSEAPPVLLAITGLISN